MLGGRGWASCPLAKLGRSSPDHYYAEYYDQGYHTWQQAKGCTSSSGAASTASATSATSRLPPTISLLPDHLLVRIFSFLTSTELASCALVSRRWLGLAWDPQLWHTITLQGEDVSGDKALKYAMIFFNFIEKIYM